MTMTKRKTKTKRRTIAVERRGRAVLHPDGSIEVFTRLPVLAFAYGSNMCLRQMRKRCPGSRLVGPGVLPGHAIEFAGWSRGWGGAVANVRREPRHMARGLVFELTIDDVLRLDRFEGVPYAYDRATMRVNLRNGRSVWAEVYTMVRPERLHMPAIPYVTQIARAYEDHGFTLKPLQRAVRELTEAV